MVLTNTARSLHVEISCKEDIRPDNDHPLKKRKSERVCWGERMRDEGNKELFKEAQEEWVPSGDNLS